MKTASEKQARQFVGLLVQHLELFLAAPTTAMQWAIQNPKDAIAVCVEAITIGAKKFAETVKVTLKVWKTIELGTHTTEALLEAIENTDEKSGKEKNEVGDYARDLITKSAYVSAVAKKPEKVDLVILTPQDLGFTETPRTDTFLTKEFCAEWSRKNLVGYVIELCSPEVGPQLRRQYQDQSNGEVLWVAMERISDSDGSPHVFDVGRSGGGGRWLDTHWADPVVQWLLGDRLVFRLRKISPPPSAA